MVMLVAYDCDLANAMLGRIDIFQSLFLMWLPRESRVEVMCTMKADQISEFSLRREP